MVHSRWILVGVVISSTAWLAAADEVVLDNGTRYVGLVVKKTDQTTTFKAMFPNGGVMEMVLPAGRIKSLTIDGVAPVFEDAVDAPVPAPEPKPAANPSAPAAPVPSAQVAPGAPKPPTPAEVKALVAKIGPTPPDWWDSVKLTYPDTLDLPGTNPAQGWQPQRNVGAYYWSIINPNPSRWKQGIRLRHHLLIVQKDDLPRLRQTIADLGDAYRHYFNDYARAAFWWSKAIEMGWRPTVGAVGSLAECYWRLGSAELAIQTLTRYGMDRTGDFNSIMLWARMGQFARALQIAEALARQTPDLGYLAAASVCRLQGKFDKAIEYYEKVLSATQASRRNEQYVSRARAGIEAIRLYGSLDMSRVADGTYAAESSGYQGPVAIELTVQGGKVASIKITRHREDMYFFHMASPATEKSIIETQDVQKVDAVSGATVTAEAILHASAKALNKGIR